MQTLANLFEKPPFAAWLLALLLAATAQATADPLPAKLFRNLESGKNQTVALYGTSVTELGEWANELRGYFDRIYPGQVSFSNTAQSGQHSDWGVQNLEARVLDHRPDLVFLEFAINDAASRHGISTTDSRQNLDAIVKALQEQNPNVEIVLQTMNPAWDSPESAPKRYASDRPELESYYDVYRSYAAVNNLPLVDNYPVWKKIMDEEPERFRQMVGDGIHPGSEASRAVTWLQVKELLDRARALAGGEATVPVWPVGSMPGNATDEPESLRSPERIDAIRVTNVSEPTLTFFPAKTPNGTAPAMIVCPGGAYAYCVVDKEGSAVAEWLNSIGISAFVLKYRVPENREGALQDIQRSLSLLRSRADQWDIDPNRLGVIGFSAGGNLAAKASNLFDQRSYTPVDQADNLSCRPDFTALVYPAYLEQDGELSEELNLNADIPPTLIVHSDDDRNFIAGSKRYHAALEKHEHPNRFLLYPTGGHGYGLHSDGAARAWPQDATPWLRNVCSPKDSNAK